MTFLNLKNLLLYAVDDLNGAYFTTVQQNVWINNAQREVQKKLIQANSTYYVRPVQTTMVVDQFDYVLPTDFLKLNRLEVVISGTGINEVKKRLKPITLNQQDMFLPSQAGVPSFYSIKKDRVTVYPAPDSAVYILRLFYSPLVADMSLDADVPDVPAEYHEYISVVAALDAFVKDDRMPTNLIAKQQFYEKLMMQTADERLQDESRSVVVMTDEGYGLPY